MFQTTNQNFYCSISVMDSPSPTRSQLGNSGVRANLTGRWHQIPSTAENIDLNDLIIYYDWLSNTDLISYYDLLWSMDLWIYRSTSPYLQYLPVSIYQSMDLSIDLSIDPTLRPSIHPCVHPVSVCATAQQATVNCSGNVKHGKTLIPIASNGVSKKFYTGNISWK